MTIISILLAIAADRLLPHLHEYRQYHHFLHYVERVRDRFIRPEHEHIGTLLLLLAPVWLAVGLLQYWISGWLFGLVGLLFYAAVLVYCIGPRDLANDVDAWCEATESGDPASGETATAPLTGDAIVSDDPAERALDISGTVLVEANGRLFAVLFWFIVLGPLGAVMYRSAAVLKQQYDDEASEFAVSTAWMHAVMVWLPARVLALTYALAGHFDAAIEGWRAAQDERPEGSEGSDEVLVMTGLGALGLEEDDFAAGGVPAVRSAMRLVWRTLTIWLVVIAVLILAGWAG